MRRLGFLSMSKKRVLAWGGVLVLSLLAGGGATTDAGVKRGEKISKSVAVPSNYRQLVARYFAANIQTGKMLKAQVSRPGVWESPLGLTSSRPIVCAKWVAQGPVIQQSYSLAFTFENGKIAEAFDPGYINPGAGGAFGAALKTAATCGKLSYGPFQEIMRSK